MAKPGYGGKILLVDLSRGTGEAAITRLDSEKYEQYGGGLGTGAAMFWEFCVAPGDWDLQDAFNPRNMVSLMTGVVSGTGVTGGARTSVSGMSPQCYPIQWFSHSNFGGAFAAMLRMAGWDGVSVIGRAESPVYINIIDDKVTIEDARSLWGLNAWECQEEIWRRTGVRLGEEWWRLDNGYSLQRPQIVTMGAAGENMTRISSLTHGGGSGAGQGAFGSVFGSKNLKAVAVLGTGGIKIADPKGLKDTREWWDKTWPRAAGGGMFGAGNGASSCTACGIPRFCHNRDRVHARDSDSCAEAGWYYVEGVQTQNLAANRLGTDICQQQSINAMETCFMGPMTFPTDHNPNFPIQPRIPAYLALGWYMKKMYDMGVIGPGTKFDTSPLPMDKFGSREFMEIYGLAISKRVGIGNLLAEGTDRFCEALGRTDDFNVLCRRTPWGFVDHWSMPNAEWAYSSLFDSRDVNNHDMDLGRKQGITCEEFVNIVAQRTGAPGSNPLWFDYNWEGDQAYKTGVFSEHKAQFVAWHHHYWLYYKESVGYCDWAYTQLYNQAHEQRFGHTPEIEAKYLNAITGRNHSFLDGLETGRRTFNLIRSIFALQGRHRNMEKFNGYYYRPGASYCGYYTTLPIYDGSNWDWQSCRELYFTEKGVETFKDHFYKLEGWGADSGIPTRKTLEDLNLKYVADYLQTKGKLG